VRVFLPCILSPSAAYRRVASGTVGSTLTRPTTSDEAAAATNSALNKTNTDADVTTGIGANDAPVPHAEAQAAAVPAAVAASDTIPAGAANLPTASLGDSDQFRFHYCQQGQ